MKQKLVPLIIASCFFTTMTFDASAAIGRSGGFSRPSFSRSVSAPKAPNSTPSVAPSQSKPGGIGGTTGSIGVRKTDVTQSAANKSNPPAAPASPQKQYTPPSTATTPVYSQPSNVTNGSTFISSLGGSFVGSALSNMIFGNHSSGGGTTVINNSGGASAPAASATVPSATGTATYVDQNGVITTQAYQPKSYGLWDFIKDVFLFGILVSLIGGIIFVFYKGFKKLREYWNRERGIHPTQPINPTQMFWSIQQMHAEGSVSGLNELLGPNIVDELTQNLQPYTLMLSRVSHEVVLSNNKEFSVHYTFYEDNARLDQVWHYEQINGAWKLNGIENI